MTERMRIDSSGNVGIGTTTPTWTLTVEGGVCITAGGPCPAAEIGGGLRVDTAGIAAGDDSGDVFDVAERYPSNEAVEAGDIMAVDTATSSKASIKKAVVGETALGVVSTHPAIAINGSELILGATSEGTTTRPLVALAGRVPVKVILDDSNTPIKKGDLITLSEIPGVGRKATTSGQTIGVALEDFDGISKDGSTSDLAGKVMVFINLGWSNLDAEMFSVATSILEAGGLDMASGRIKANYALDMDGKDIVNVRSILSQSGNWSIDENGKLTVQEIQTKKLCLDDICITKDELKKLLDMASLTSLSPTPTQTPTDTPTPTPTPELPIPSEQGSVTESSILDLPTESTDSGQIGTTIIEEPLPTPTIIEEPTPTPAASPTPEPTPTLVDESEPLDTLPVNEESP